LGGASVSRNIRQSHSSVLVRSNNRLPAGQLRFAQARNWLELLHSTHRGFSSRLAARFLSRLWHVRPCQKNR
jgi:hypothetical protein